jgi:hypothetical protein
MSYVLTVIHPPVNGAAYGKAEVHGPFPFKVPLSTEIRRLIRAHGTRATTSQIISFSMHVVGEPDGTECTLSRGALTFRIDPAAQAPHPCPCGNEDGDTPEGCGRLVLPGDHAYADAEDALCRGCFTWNRGDVQCLPENTAHPAESASELLTVNSPEYRAHHKNTIHPEEN